MIFLISSLVILCSLLAILSGVWVIVGLVTELIHPSNAASVSSRADTAPEPTPQKKQNSSKLL